MSDKLCGYVSWKGLLRTFLIMIAVGIPLALAFGGYVVGADAQLDKKISKTDNKVHGLDVKMAVLQNSVNSIARHMGIKE